MAPKINRVIPITALSDSMSIDSIVYNFQSGANKNLPIGPHLLPIPTSSTTWTTNVSAGPVALPAIGMNLAIYNNAGTAGSITIGATSALASLAIGATDVNGNVGCACPPNAWTYLSMGNNQYVVSSAATLIVYLIDDSTYISPDARV